MKSLTFDAFSQWLDDYGRASAENNPQASAALFAGDASYYETPFADPIIGREAIYHYWAKGAQTLRDKTSSHHILAVRDNLGIARWQATFTVIDSSKRVALDCLFVAEFAEDGKCRVFREWWHTRLNDDPENQA